MCGSTPSSVLPVEINRANRTQALVFACALGLATVANAQPATSPDDDAAPPAPPAPPASQVDALAAQADLTYSPYEPWTEGESTDTVPYYLESIYTPRRGILDVPALDAPFEQIVDWTRALEEKTALRIGAAYTMIFQQASGGPGRREGASGDFDIFGTWTPIGRGTPNAGQLVFSAEYRFKMGPLPASELGPEIGTLQRTTGGFNDRGWVWRDLYWIQRLFDDKLRLLLGRADISDFFGATWMQNINASFSNRAFSGNSVVPSPGHGATAGFSIRPVDEFYLTLGAANAWSQTNSSKLSKLDDKEFFSFGEFGYTPVIENLGRGRYRVLLWNLDSREEAGAPGDSGFSLIIDQELGEMLQVFARYEYADKGVTGIKSSYEAGFGFRGLLGDPNNLGGIGFGYSEPTGEGRDEKVVEIFHRWQLTGFTQFSLGAQAIIDPTNAPDSDVIGVFTARFRIVF
jgi:porin